MRYWERFQAGSTVAGAAVTVKVADNVAVGSGALRGPRAQFRAWGRRVRTHPARRGRDQGGTGGLSYLRKKRNKPFGNSYLQAAHSLRVYACLFDRLDKGLDNMVAFPYRCWLPNDGEPLTWVQGSILNAQEVM
jgi:hypothetical protein